MHFFKRPIFKLIFSILVCEVVGLIGSVFTAPSIVGWYAELAKPTFNPPNWIFAPVWIILFALMGIAAFLIWQHGWRLIKVKKALAVFSVQLLLNMLWSFIFFALERPDLALAEIVLLWIMILVTTIAFFKISKHAGWLMVPYILWVSFAVYLNYSIWILNSAL